MRFHKDLGFPARFTRPTHRSALIHSRHSKDQSARRGITIANVIDFAKVDVIEVGYAGNTLNHLLVRKSYDAKNDVCLALKPWNGKWFVKTMWLNSNSDTHRTLDTSKYSRP